MAINFPDAPSINDEFTAGSQTWKWTGTVWETVGAITATAAEINVLDGITATTTELNYTDGVTSAIQTQLDGKQADVITTQGDLVVGGTGGSVERLAIGTADQVLTSNGTSLSWAAVTGSGGEDGLSAYEVAVLNGFVGDEAAWLASLVGPTGATGPQGIQGEIGATGATGPAGIIASTTEPLDTSVIWVDTDDIAEPSVVFTSATVASNITAELNYKYFVDTSAARTITLPLSPQLGDEVRFFDATGTAGTNVITIVRNGHKINGLEENAELDVNGVAVSFIYTGVYYGWRFG